MDWEGIRLSCLQNFVQNSGKIIGFQYDILRKIKLFFIAARIT
jgi:hypothetical protein